MFKLSKRSVKLTALLLVLVFAIGVAAGCGGGTKAEATMVMADPGWDSVRLHNHIAGYILEHGYNVKTESVVGTTPITWQGLLENDIQIYMEVWSENLPTYNDDIADGKVLELVVNFDDNVQGLYVPAYMIHGDPERGIEPITPDLKTVKDLKEYADVFADPDVSGMGRIYGAISGWEIDGILFNKYEAYGLDEMYTYFRPGSDAAMIAAIVSAYESGEPWVGYYWEPTWVTGTYDLILLEDEPFIDMEQFEAGMTEMPANRVTVAVHPSVKEEHPEVVDFLSRYETSSALTATGLAYMNENEASERDAAIWFLKENDDLLAQWVTDADRLSDIRTALEKE